MKKVKLETMLHKQGVNFTNVQMKRTHYNSGVEVEVETGEFSRACVASVVDAIEECFMQPVAQVGHEGDSKFTRIRVVLA